MKKTKLFELLFSLSQEDLQDLREFAGLSTNKLPKRDIKVLSVLIESMQLLNSDVRSELKLEGKILQKFFDTLDEGENKKQWNYTKNRLTNILNRYIAILQLEQQPAIRDRLLLQFYQQKQLDKNFNGYLRNTHKNQETGSIDFDQEYHNFKFQEILLSQKEGQRKEMKELQLMNQALEDFYLENKLRLQAEQYNRQRIINAAQPESMLLEELTPEALSEKNISIQLFYHIYAMMKEPEKQKYYFTVKRLFYQIEQRVVTEYKRTICEYLMNQCLYYCHTGQAEFAKEYIQYVRYLIKSKLFSPRNGLSIAKYSNTVYMALVSDELDWAEKFVKEYAKLVKHPKIDAIKQLNLANILFHKGLYQTSLGFIRDYNYSGLYFKITYDKLAIKLYFEENMEGPLKSKLEAFEKFIKRKNKLPSDRKAKNLNFVKAVRTLLNSKSELNLKAEEQYMLLDYLWLKKKREV